MLVHLIPAWETILTTSFTSREDTRKFFPLQAVVRKYVTLQVVPTFALSGASVVIAMIHVAVEHMTL